MKKMIVLLFMVLSILCEVNGTIVPVIHHQQIHNNRNRRHSDGDSSNVRGAYKRYNRWDYVHASEEILAETKREIEDQERMRLVYDVYRKDNSDITYFKVRTPPLRGMLTGYTAVVYHESGGIYSIRDDGDLVVFQKTDCQRALHILLFFGGLILLLLALPIFID